MDYNYIEEARNYDKAFTYIKDVVKNYASEDVLVFFDIDQTLLVPANPACQVPNMVKHKDILLNLRLKYSCFYPIILHGYFILMEHHKLIDARVLDLLKFLDESKIKSLAFTATPNFVIHGNDLREVRYKQLEKNNICFEKNFTEREIIFDDLTLFHGHPCFYRGIIFSNGTDVLANKGVVMKNYLNRLERKPRCVIFLDDNFKNILDINSTIIENKMDIDYYGILYSGSLYHDSPEVSAEEFEATWNGFFSRESVFGKKIERKNFIC